MEPGAGRLSPYLRVTDDEAPMARIDRFTSRAEADLACGLLNVHGIDAYVSSDDAGGTRPDIPFGIGGTAVVVADEDLEAALSLLDDGGG